MRSSAKVRQAGGGGGTRYTTNTIGMKCGVVVELRYRVGARARGFAVTRTCRRCDAMCVTFVLVLIVCVILVNVWTVVR